MPDYSYEMKIPASRIAVLIGKTGAVKKQIENETGVKITVDSMDGDVFLFGDDALNLYTVREMVTAIGRGFNPDIALQLIKPDYTFEQINLADKVNTKNHLIRIKGRVIGSNGKARELIEELTDCKISVFGKTISIIGRVESANVCRKAIESLVKGSRHAAVYRFLEKHRRELKKRTVFGK